MADKHWRWRLRAARERRRDVSSNWAALQQQVTQRQALPEYTMDKSSRRQIVAIGFVVVSDCLAPSILTGVSCFIIVDETLGLYKLM